MPASANGIYGFRPSLGCYNFSTGMGLVPAEFTRDTVGMRCFHLTQVTQVIYFTSTELLAASKGLSAPVANHLLMTMLAAFAIETWFRTCGQNPHSVLWVTPLMMLTVACSLANTACKQHKNVGHMLVQVSMSGPALAQESVFGINICVFCATHTPQLAFDSPIFTNLTAACFSLVCIHKIHLYICIVPIYTLPMKVILTSCRPPLCLLQVRWPGRSMT